MNLVKIENKNTMTSREVAEITGKEHKNILVDIRDEIEKLENKGIRAELIFQLGEYLDKNNQKRPQYNLTKEGVLQLAARYDAVVRFRLIEKVTRPKEYSQKELLLMNLEAIERIEELEEENQIQKQVIAEYKTVKEYVDTILSSEDTMSITQIAADYGLSAMVLNGILNENRVIRKVGNQWILYVEHMNKGYTKSETITVKRKDGTDKVVPNTKWTQKGRLFIHNLLESLGIKANMDKEREGA
jgi:phage regulatory protein, rha family